MLSLRKIASGSKINLELRIDMSLAGTKAIFLDRDGVINRDAGYTYKIEDLEVLPGVLEALKDFESDGFKLFIVTNQSGIARGYYKVEDFFAFQKALVAELQGVTITDTRFCPHLDGCSCRKPLPGMLLDLIQDHQINPAASFMIGDRHSDIEAGLAAGVRGVQIVSAHKRHSQACVYATSLKDAHETLKNLNFLRWSTIGHEEA